MLTGRLSQQGAWIATATDLRICVQCRCRKSGTNTSTNELIVPLIDMVMLCLSSFLVCFEHSNGHSECLHAVLK